MALKGFVESVEASRVTGWALMQDWPDRAVTVAAMLDGEIRGLAVADRHREDLKDAGYCNGDHGFVIEMPTPLTDSERESLHVEVLLPVPTLGSDPKARPRHVLKPWVPPAAETQRPVFVLGAARSGTSAMAVALLKSGRYQGFGEGHLLPILHFIRVSLDKYYSDNKAAIDAGTWLSRVDREFFMTVVKGSCIDLTARAFPTGYWMDKTPTVTAILVAPILKEIWPEARFIFMKRRAIENVASRMRKFPGVHFDSHCRDWTAVMTAWQNVREQLSDAAIEIEHLDVAQEPDQNGNIVGNFLQLPEINKARLIQSLIHDHPQQTDKRFASISSIDELPWTKEQKSSLQKLCGDTMQSYGYSFTHDYWTSMDAHSSRASVAT